MLDAALEAAGRGWPVLPLHHPTDTGCSCRDAGCQNVGKHPRTPHGLKDATTDVDAIRSWWTKWPEANIGARTGVAFDVLDIDYAGHPAEAAEWPDTLAMPGGPVVRTGKGWHFYLAPTGEGNRTKFIGQCDWRGRNGYVILPPSLHESRSRYAWYSPPDLALRPAPVELVELLTSQPRTTERSRPSVAPNRPARPGEWSAHGIIGRLAVAEDGTRNNVLNWAAHRIGADVRARRAPSDLAVAALDQLAAVAARIGLGDHEIEATIRSGYTSGVAS